MREAPLEGWDAIAPDSGNRGMPEASSRVPPSGFDASKTSGSKAFDTLRDHLDSNREVRREVEFAFSSLLTAANPTDRGLRFLFGNGAEWIMACAAWSAGVLTAPAGHNVDGFDLEDLLDSATSLWSVKASAAAKASQIRLKNFMGDGSGQVWDVPTLFVSPYLGGAVLIDPELHPEVREEARNTGDALVLSAGAVKKFAESHPKNIVRFDVAMNQGGVSADPYAFIKSVIAPEHFPILAKPFLAASPRKEGSRVDDITQLVALRDRGALTEAQFQKVIEAVVG